MGVHIGSSKRANSVPARYSAFYRRSGQPSYARPRGGTIQQVRLPARLEGSLAHWLHDENGTGSGDNGIDLSDPEPQSRQGIPWNHLLNVDDTSPLGASYNLRPPTPPARSDPNEELNSSNPPSDSQVNLQREPVILNFMDSVPNPVLTARPGSLRGRRPLRRRRSISPHSRVNQRPQLRRTNAMRLPPLELRADRGLYNDQDEQVQDDMNQMREELLAVRRYWWSVSHNNQSTSDLPGLNSAEATDSSNGTTPMSSVDEPVRLSIQDLPPPANPRRTEGHMFKTGYMRRRLRRRPRTILPIFRQELRDPPSGASGRRGSSVSDTNRPENGLREPIDEVGNSRDPPDEWLTRWLTPTELRAHRRGQARTRRLLARLGLSETDLTPRLQHLIDMHESSEDGRESSDHGEPETLYDELFPANDERLSPPRNPIEHHTVDIARPFRNDRFPMSNERTSDNRHVRFLTDDDGRLHTFGTGYQPSR